MEKQRRTKALVIVVLLIVIAGLTVAFASLSSVLNIKGTAYLDAAKWGIKFKNLSEPIKVGDAKVTGTAKIEETKSAEITGINVSLSNPGDKVTYTVDLVNEGTINAKIDNIEKTVLTSEQQKYLTFKVTDKEGKAVSEGDILSAGETRNLTITIEFIKDLTKEDLPTNASTISLSYKLNFVQTDEKKDTTIPSEVQNELPSGYKRVEYLESTGTQYIDTGYIPQKNSIMKYDFKSNKTKTEGFTTLFGCQKSIYEERIYILFGTSNNVQINLLNSSYTGYFSLNNDGTFKLNAVGTFFTNDRTTYVINQLDEIISIGSNTWNFSDEYLDFIPTKNTIMLLTRNNNGVPDNTNEYSKGYSYGFEVLEESEQKMNLIPCLDSDNKPCMYDTVSKKTFYNSGTGEFLYGNIIQ